MIRAPGLLRGAALALLLAPGLAIAGNSQARYYRVEEPQLLKWDVYDLELGVDAERERDDSSTRGSDAHSTYEDQFVAPTLTVGMGGSVYHPNFLHYDLFGEGEYGWGEERSGTGAMATRRNRHHLERFRGSLEFFESKPVHASATADYGRSYRDYDFFTRSTVETMGYGGRVVYRSPDYYLGISHAYSSEDVIDSLIPTSTRQHVTTFDAQNNRESGSSLFNYTFNQTEFSGATTGDVSRSSDHTFSVGDGERFGSREQYNLQTGASYSHHIGPDEPTDNMTANASLDAAHRPNLSSYYEVSYDRFSASTLTSRNLLARAEVRHQLYESLTSTLSGEGSDAETSTPDSSGYARRLGVGWAESYTKRLGSEHRLRLDNSLTVDQVQQSGTGEAVNERHVFLTPPDIESFLLNLPNVTEASVIVKDSGDVRTFARGIDYELFPDGSRTEVRRIPGGSIPEGATVLVSYDAKPGATGGYQMMSEWFGARIELWRNLWALYARVSDTFNNAPADLLVPETRATTVGTEVTLSHVSAGAEHETYESEGASYESTGFFQSGWINPAPGSSLNLGVSERFINHQDADRRERDYRFTLGYRQRLTSRLRASLTAGFDMRRGEGVDQDLSVVRPELDYRIGQTTIEIHYDYEHNLYLRTEERTKELFSFSLRRVI